MQPIAGRPFWVVDFDQDGRPLGDDGLAQSPQRGQVRDLVVLCHGWNNSREGALGLYADLFGRMAPLIAPDRSVGFVGVLWPSLLLPDDVPAATGPVMAGSAGAGGGAQASGAAPTPVPPGPAASGAAIAEALAPAFPGREDTLAEIGALLDRAPEDGAELRRCHDLVVSLVARPDAGKDEDTGELALLDATPREAFETMAGLARPDVGDAQGTNPFAGLWRGAKEVLRTLSYYEMKDRAGVVGASGLGPLVAGLARPDLRVHLAGHSFGARLVSFALTALEPATSPVASLTLVQGAFSHFAFSATAPVAAGAGRLAGHVDRVHGPLVSTHTPNDRAVGWWYPNASVLARQDNQASTSALYRWGAVGHDGYQQVAAAETRVVPTRTPYGFPAGRFTNVEVSDVVRHDLSWFSGAHSDIRHDEIAWLLVSAAGLA
ncbi:hypothetical protein [Actinomycetospora aeridis]|uniref:Serine-threonine protein kinase n=1 Tax=Actinomycetospora aeridis TaxID=3129231 RepID=A0ABU8NB70_9PSEU